jgi:hypothetical protein
MKTHYEKAAEEIIAAAKTVAIFRKNPFSYLAWIKGKKLIIEMLRANFVAKKSKFI